LSPATKASRSLSARLLRMPTLCVHTGVAYTGYAVHGVCGVDGACVCGCV
jgi:hypothetical protein